MSDRFHGCVYLTLQIKINMPMTMIPTILRPELIVTFSLNIEPRGLTSQLQQHQG